MKETVLSYASGLTAPHSAGTILPTGFDYSSELSKRELDKSCSFPLALRGKPSALACYNNTLL